MKHTIEPGPNGFYWHWGDRFLSGPHPTRIAACAAACKYMAWLAWSRREEERLARLPQLGARRSA